MIGTAFPLLLVALIMVCLMVARTVPAPMYTMPAVPATASSSSSSFSSEIDAGRALGQRRRRRQERAAAMASSAVASAPPVEQPPQQTSQSSNNLTHVADPRCHAAPNTGYAGDGAVVWGLGKPGFHLPDAASCCRACMAHNEICGAENARGKSWWPTRPEMHCGGDRSVACTIWTWCPLERCFAFDIHKHEFGECWLSTLGSPRPCHRQFPCKRTSTLKLALSSSDAALNSGEPSLARRVPKGHATDSQCTEHEDDYEAKGPALWA